MLREWSDLAGAASSTQLQVVVDKVIGSCICQLWVASGPCKSDEILQLVHWNYALQEPHRYQLNHNMLVAVGSY